MQILSMLQKPNDSVPNFKMMNDAAIALADKECRAAFVTECIHKIETEIERVCQRSAIIVYKRVSNIRNGERTLADLLR